MLDLQPGSTRARVFGEIWSQGPISRRDLVDRTGLTKSTVFQLTEELRTEGLILREGLETSGSQGGRRAALLHINPDSVRVAGVHLGTTHTVVTIADTFGRTLDFASWPTLRRDAEASLNEVANAIRTLGEKYGAPSAVGVAVPGLVDRDTGVCLNAPNLGWRNVPVGASLRSHIDIPVIALNTVQAMAVAEMAHLQTDRTTTMAMLYAGTGIGTALIADGVLVRGSRGLAGELGHLQVRKPENQDAERCSCGRIGCLESVVGLDAILIKAQKRGLREGNRRPTLKYLRQLAFEGDDIALEIIREVGRELGNAVASVVQTLNPDIIVLAGALTALDDMLLSPLRDTVMELTQPELRDALDIRRSLLDDQGKLQGAISLGLEAIGVPVNGAISP